MLGPGCIHREDIARLKCQPVSESGLHDHAIRIGAGDVRAFDKSDLVPSILRVEAADHKIFDD